MKQNNLKQGRISRGIMSVSANATKILTELNETVSLFRAEHQKQIDEIKKGVNDPARAEAIAKASSDIISLQKQIDALTVKQASAQMGGGNGQSVKDPEYSAAFNSHFRKGESGFNAALNKGADAEGGYLAPVEWDRTVTRQLTIESPMRAISAVQVISTNGYTKLFSKRGTSSGWVGESSQRPQTETSKFHPMTYTTGELYANPAATQQLLDDAELNVEQWLSEEILEEFAYQESLAFLSGDGINKPTGILTYIDGNTNANKHPLGAITTVSSGSASGIGSDSIIELVNSLPSKLSAGARFAMNRNTLTGLLKLKDGNGNYLWQPSFSLSTPATLAGYGISEMPDMPDVAANSTPILFGDFKRSYLIIDRVGIRVLRDPFSNKPFVQFYTTKRVGGGLLNPEPMRALKIGS